MSRLPWIAAVLLVVPALVRAEAPVPADEMPLTFKSAAARGAFARGRSLYYDLRTSAARKAFEEATKADPDSPMAWAYLALATRPVAAGRTAIERAGKAAKRGSPSERLFVEALAAQARGDAALERRKLDALVEAHPRDWRVLVTAGNRLIRLGQPADAIPLLERASTAPEAAPWNDLGYAYLHAGRVDEAIAALRKYASLVPGEPNPHDSLGEALLRAGKTREAAAEYEKALELDPAFVVANEGLGHARLLAGEFEAARDAYRRLADGAADDYDRMNGLGWIAASWLHEGRLDETLRALEDAAAVATRLKEPTWPLVFDARRAHTLAELGRTKDALALADAVERASAKAPVTPALRRELAVRAAVVRGFAQLAADDASAAKRTLEALRAGIFAEAAPAPQLVGWAAALTGAVVAALPEEAAKAFSIPETTRLDEDPWALALVADALEKQGRAEEAQRARARVLKANVVTPELGFVRPRLLAGRALSPQARFGPVPVSARSGAALALFVDARRLGETYKRSLAVAALERAVSLEPDFALASLYLSIFMDSPEEGAKALAKARQLAQAGKTSEGERLLIEAWWAGEQNDPATKEARLAALAALHPLDWRPQAYLGEHHFRMKDRPRAIVALKEAVRRAPNEPYAYNGLGYALAYEGRFDDAIAALRKYEELSPGESNPHDSLAEVLLMAGRPAEAEKAYRRSLELSPQFVASHEGLGHARMLTGDVAGARDAYRRMGEVATLPGERVAAQVWAALSFAWEGRFDEAAATVARAEVLAEQAKDRLGEALLEARRAPLMAEAGRAKDGISLAQHALQSRAKLSPGGAAVVERIALFGRAWSELAAKDVAAAKATGSALADVAVRTKHPEAIAYAGIVAGAVDLAEGRAADAARKLEALDPLHPLVQALLAEAYAATNRADKAAVLKAALAKPIANHLDLAFARRRAGVR